MLNEIKQQSENKLVICPVGVGSAFAKKNFNSSFIIAKDNKTILFDLGATVPMALHQKGISPNDFDAVMISHAHADHAGGLEELLFMGRYVKKKKPTLILAEFFSSTLWKKTLSGGISLSESPALKFKDMADLFIAPVDYKGFNDRLTSKFIYDGISFEFIQTLHVPSGVKDFDEAMWSCGLLVEDEIFISGDTQFDQELINRVKHCELIFHDCQLFDAPEDKLVHATYNQLKTLPDEIKSKMYLYHYGDNFEQFNPEEDGFKGFTKPWEIYFK